jgi:acyl-coenzyme A synthetase/AMP-(fatty) acid ligase
VHSKSTGNAALIHTGDRFMRDSDGSHFFRGRADDLIKISGQWVYPLEVELCLADHPQVRECAVLAVELPDRRMTLKAVVVMNNCDFDVAETTKTLQNYVKGKLLPYKYPRGAVSERAAENRNRKDRPPGPSEDVTMFGLGKAYHSERGVAGP